MSESHPPPSKPRGKAASSPVPAEGTAEGTADGTAQGSVEDVVFVHGPVEDGEGMRVIRKRSDTIEIGEIRPMREGRPLQGDLVRLKARKDHERVFDVEVLASREELAEKAGRSHAGPARVATRAYRQNWDAIFGRREGDDELPN